LRDAIDEARAAEIDPVRYSALLLQYWLVVATRNAEIELSTWNPNLGARANTYTFRAVYANYLRLANHNPEFWWCAMAGLAGAPFAGGFADIGGLENALGRPVIRCMLDTLSAVSKVGRLPGLHVIPADIRLTVRHMPSLTTADLQWYRIRLMIMQKHIFTDIVTQHEAYLRDGMAGIDEMHRARLIDDSARTSWRSITTGRTAGFEDALVRMAGREQNQVIADQWDTTAAGRNGMGRVMTYASTIVGRPIIPGVRPPGVFAPILVEAKVAGRTLSVRMPLPDFNWADREARWHYIATDLIPRHQEMKRRPRYAATILGEPFPDIIARGRLANRIPDLISTLSQWHITWA
jgi:hypothetical protein